RAWGLLFGFVDRCNTTPVDASSPDRLRGAVSSGPDTPGADYARRHPRGVRHLVIASFPRVPVEVLPVEVPDTSFRLVPGRRRATRCRATRCQTPRNWTPRKTPRHSPRSGGAGRGGSMPDTGPRGVRRLVIAS